jgi:hypothetical protein
MQLEMNTLENPILSMQNEGKLSGKYDDSCKQEQHLDDSAFAANIAYSSDSHQDQKRILNGVACWRRISSFLGIFDVSFPSILKRRK